MNSPPIRRRDFLKTGALAVAGASAGPSVSAAGASPSRPAGRPNIVYIMSDQQHWQALGCVDPFFQTPHLDAFARDAALFERAFCTTPQCSPSRSSMLTGRYPSTTGVMGNMGAAGGKNLARKTIGAMLREAGYHTGYFGKWHLGNDPRGNAGWDEQARRQPDPLTTEKAVAFLRSRKGRQEPFGLIVSYVNPHDIYHFRPGQNHRKNPNTPLPPSWSKENLDTKPSVQKEFMTRDQGRLIWEQPREVWQAYREFYREKVRLYDAQAGKVLAALGEAGLEDNTLVIIGSDHGDMDTHHRLVFKGPFMYEQMIRVPLLVRLPAALGGRLRGRVADFDTVNVDLVPTLRDFAGLEAIPTDGLSLKPLLTGAENPPRRDFVIGQYYSKQQWVNPIRMIRTARFKYNKYLGHGEELYDLANDPHELVNLADDGGHAGIRRALAAELNAWIKAHHDPFDSLKTTALNKGHGRPGREKGGRAVDDELLDQK